MCSGDKVCDVIIIKNQNIGNFIGSKIAEAIMKKTNIIKLGLNLNNIDISRTVGIIPSSYIETASPEENPILNPGSVLTPCPNNNSKVFAVSIDVVNRRSRSSL